MPAGISQKADIGALQAEIDEQRRTITGLRAEIAASQERQARQALHFHEELRRLGPSISEGKSLDAESPPKKSLAERITAPRVVRPAVKDAAGAGETPETPREGRPASYLRALTRGRSDKEATTPEGSPPPPLPASEAEATPSGTKPACRPRLYRTHQRNREGLDQ